MQDQHFYAHACGAIGAGPYPIDFTDLSVPKLSAALVDIVRNPSYKEVAARLATQLNAENGAQARGGRT